MSVKDRKNFELIKEQLSQAFGMSEHDAFTTFVKGSRKPMKERKYLRQPLRDSVGGVPSEKIGNLYVSHEEIGARTNIGRSY